MDYRGVVFVLLFNCSDKDSQVEEGDRIAQLILECISSADAFEVSDLDKTLCSVDKFEFTGTHVCPVVADTPISPALDFMKHIKQSNAEVDNVVQAKIQDNIEGWHKTNNDGISWEHCLYVPRDGKL